MGPHTTADAPAGTDRLAPDPVTQEVVELIGTVVARYHEEYEQVAAGHSLTGAQARVLALLAREPTPMRQVARRLKCEPSNVTGIVDRLESRGLAVRRPDPADRRVKLAAATDDGVDLARRLRASLDFAREPLAGLTSLERRLLRDLLQRMLGEGATPDEHGMDGEEGGGDGARQEQVPPEGPAGEAAGSQGSPDQAEEDASGARGDARPRGLARGGPEDG